MIIKTIIDLLSEEEAALKIKKIISKLNYQGPVYQVSALQSQGTEKLCFDLLEQCSLDVCSPDEAKRNPGE